MVRALLGVVLAIAASALLACGAPAARVDTAAQARAVEASRTAEVKRRLEAARDLLAEKKYDEAIAEDLRLAGELKDGDQYRQALADAVNADIDKTRALPYMEQVKALSAFYEQVPAEATSSTIVRGHVRLVLLGYARTYVDISRKTLEDRDKFVRDLREDGHGRRIVYHEMKSPITAQQFKEIASKTKALGEPEETRRAFLALAELAPGLTEYAEMDSKLGDGGTTVNNAMLRRFDRANTLVRTKLPVAKRALDGLR